MMSGRAAASRLALTFAQLNRRPLDLRPDRRTEGIDESANPGARLQHADHAFGVGQPGLVGKQRLRDGVRDQLGRVVFVNQRLLSGTHPGGSADAARLIDRPPQPV